MKQTKEISRKICQNSREKQLNQLFGNPNSTKYAKFRGILAILGGLEPLNKNPGDAPDWSQN